MKYILSIIVILIPSLLFGQVDFKEEKEKIYVIKKDASFIYSEGIAETEDEALKIAEQELRSEVLRVVNEQESLKETETVLVNAIKRNSEKIQLKRGTLERVFLYVSKDNIFAADQIMTVSRTIETNSPEMTQEPERLEQEPEEITLSNEAGQTTSPILQDILLASDGSTLQNYLKAQKERHKIMWGNVGTEIKPAWYIVVVSGNEIKAVFDKGLNTRINLLSGEREPLSKYSNYNKIWFIIYD